MVGRNGIALVIVYSGVWLCPVALRAQQDISAEVLFSGHVLTATRAPLAGARVLVQTGTQTSHQFFTDPQGRFATRLLPVGHYRLAVEHPGYFPFRSHDFEIGTSGENIEFLLTALTEHNESMQVTSSPLSIDMDTTTAKQGISRKELLDIPFPNTNDFRSALRIIPGVTRDNRGGLHINGSSEEQVLFLLDGFNINDPLTGRFETRFNVESVQSAEVSSGTLPAEYGKGSAAALSVRSRMGHDRFQYGATNFFPGFENRKGWTIGDWTPRLSLSGPIWKGRAWFSNSFDTQYVKTVVRDRPKGDDRTSSMRFSDMLSTQVNLSPTNILHVGGLWNHWNAGRTGLTALDPMETTIDRRARQYFFHAKDQMYFRRGLLIEYGVAVNRTFGREIPQGPGMLLITPLGKRGNYYIDAVRGAGREQALFNFSLPSFSLRGSHMMRFGADLDRVTYGQRVSRSGFVNFSEDNRPVQQTVFGGTGRLAKKNYEAASYFQDSWRVRSGLLLEAGLRGDWDRILSKWSAAPRIGFAFSPPRLDNTKLSGGLARIYDASSLRLFTRPDDQYALTSYYLPDGTLHRGPALSFFSPLTNRSLRRPYADSANLSLEHHWPGRLAIRGDLHYRRGTDGFTYLNSVEWPDSPAPDVAASYSARALDALYVLTNDRKDTYRACSITVRHNVRTEYEWMVNYTFSRALSNAVVDVNVDEPFTVLNNAGPMPWDSPHRLLAWSYLPLPFKNWAIAAFTDARSGYPFSVRQDGGTVLGKVNSQRFPTFFELNLHLERRFAFRGHRWAWRMGANNITGRINPDAVNSFAGSSRFGQFYGGTGRSVNFRIRWLGRV